MKKRFTEEQIIGFLREAEAGLAVKDLCRRHGFSEASYYLWRSKFGGMSVSDAKRLKELEAENTRLKKLLAEQMLDMAAMKEHAEAGRCVQRGLRQSIPSRRYPSWAAEICTASPVPLVGQMNFPASRRLV